MIVKVTTRNLEELHNIIERIGKNKEIQNTESFIEIEMLKEKIGTIPESGRH
jgi:hypothetical protein